jgi:hypothetical protein
MIKRKIDDFFNHFWTQESGLSSMLILLCLVNFVIAPLFADYTVVRMVINIFWMIFLLAGILTMSKNKTHVMLLVSLPVGYTLLRITMFFYSVPLLVYADLAFGICTFLLLISLVLNKVFEHGPVTVHRIVGSIVVYLLIGNMWAVIYDFMYMDLPGSFNISLNSASDPSIHASFLYFSYTTLTTTGYGDILPVHPFVRNLAVVEQIIGVLYPVILIGRLVSLRVEPADKS